MVREVGVVRKDVGWHWNLIRESVVVEESSHFWVHCWGSMVGDRVQWIGVCV